MSHYEQARRQTDIPPGGNDVVTPNPDDATYTHSRKYDHGLIPPPTGVKNAGRIVITLVVGCAVAFFAAFYSISEATQASCEQRQETSTILREQIARDDKRLIELGAQIRLTEEQIEMIHRDNIADIQRLMFPPC